MRINDNAFYDRSIARHQPFWLSSTDICKEEYPFPIKVLVFDQVSLYAIAIGTDEYPLLWIWYWFMVRLEKSIELLRWVWSGSNQ